jgi:hypothetical protein
MTRTVVTAQAWRRWALVLAVVLVLAAVPVVVNLWPVRAAAVDPVALRARIAASGTQPYQGYAQSAGLLGLPSLPDLTEISALASSTTEMRAWYASPDSWRVDVLGEGTERDLYRTPRAEFTWDFADNDLTQVDGDQPVRLPRAADLTPPELVRRILGGAAGDRVEKLAAKRVAGVDAAGLRLVPASPDTTVARVDVWADPRSGLPLQAEVTAKGGTRPVFVTRFLEIHLSAPAAGVLTPPEPRPGIDFAATRAPDILGEIDRRTRARLPADVAGLARRDAVTGLSAAGIYGTGLSSLVVVALPRHFGAQIFDQIDTYGHQFSSDATVIATGLLSVLAVRTGGAVYLAAGLVTPALMKRAATALGEAGA